jgi:hypothetical protein
MNSLPNKTKIPSGRKIKTQFRYKSLIILKDKTAIEMIRCNLVKNHFVVHNNPHLLFQVIRGSQL